MRKLMLSLCALWVLLVTGCNTMEGVGRDIKGGGNAIEDAARDTKHKL